jgi:hypothetical protein
LAERNGLHGIAESELRHLGAPAPAWRLRLAVIAARHVTRIEANDFIRLDVLHGRILPTTAEDGTTEFRLPDPRPPGHTGATRTTYTPADTGEQLALPIPPPVATTSTPNGPEDAT